MKSWNHDADLPARFHEPRIIAQVEIVRAEVVISASVNHSTFGPIKFSSTQRGLYEDDRGNWSTASAASNSSPECWSEESTSVIAQRSSPVRREKRFDQTAVIGGTIWSSSLLARRWHVRFR